MSPQFHDTRWRHLQPVRKSNSPKRGCLRRRGEGNMAGGSATSLRKSVFGGDGDVSERFESGPSDERRPDVVIGARFPFKIVRSRKYRRHCVRVGASGRALGGLIRANLRRHQLNPERGKLSISVEGRRTALVPNPRNSFTAGSH